MGAHISKRRRLQEKRLPAPQQVTGASEGREQVCGGRAGFFIGAARLAVREGAACG